MYPDFKQFKTLSKKYNCIPVTTSYIADTITPVSALAILNTDENCFLLESITGGTSVSRYSFLGFGKAKIFKCHDKEITIIEKGKKKVFISNDPLEELNKYALNQCNSSAESRCTVLNAIHFTKDFVNISLAVMSHAAITCRVHSRFAAKGINLKPRIITETVISIMLLHKSRLNLGIALNTVGSVRNILIAANLTKAQHLEVRTPQSASTPAICVHYW
jgi:anthranilate/para-aminobenzoate synthase component I